MKKLIMSLVALAMVISMGACSYDTVRHINGPDKGLPVQSDYCGTCDINLVVLFDYDDDAIRADQVAKIDEAVLAMEQNPATVVVIKGNASEEGASDYNMDLSQRRADAVKASLIEKGVPAANIKDVVAGGETTEFGDKLAPNRRVVVLSVQ